MEKLYGSLKDYPELPQPTGNEGLDAALIKTIPKCKENDIKFSYAVLGKLHSVESVAMGTLMDNLLSNGIEACLDVPQKREIELVIKNVSDGLEIWQENTIKESVLEKNPDFRSRKSEKERHGFGMESIYKIVREFDGTYECWEEDNRFCQRVYLIYKEEN